LHTQARAHGNNSINQKGRLSKLEKGTQTFIFVIEITLQLGGSIYLCKITDLIDAFLFGKWIEISDGQWLPIIVNMEDRLIANVSYKMTSHYGEWSKTVILLGSHSE
jgi:hypothetical protein